MNGKPVHDFTLYSGVLGTAFLLFRAYQITNDKNDLKLCCRIVMACDSVSLASGYSLCLLLFRICTYVGI